MLFKRNIEEKRNREETQTTTRVREGVGFLVEEEANSPASLEDSSFDSIEVSIIRAHLAHLSLGSSSVQESFEFVPFRERKDLAVKENVPPRTVDMSIKVIKKEM